ncbi:hypothetical protein lerEdw1_002750 [Lerista edwardsae]|nr:hypothetical protein lerEdw1_002750 [Lerista edwardsae]
MVFKGMAPGGETPFRYLDPKVLMIRPTKIKPVVRCCGATVWLFLSPPQRLILGYLDSLPSCTFGEMEEGEGAPLEENSQSEKEGGTSDREGSTEGDSSSSPCSERAEPKDNAESPKEPDKLDFPEQPPEPNPWNGPGAPSGVQGDATEHPAEGYLAAALICLPKDEGELEVTASEGQSKICARQSVPKGCSWGPYQGNIHSEATSPGHVGSRIEAVGACGRGRVLQHFFRSREAPAKTPATLKAGGRWRVTWCSLRDGSPGVCHSCGFISTTRDILYSHLVTNHMICQPGSKGEVYSPGTTVPAAAPPGPLTPGVSVAGPAPALKCSFCGYVADSLPGLQQHVVLHSTAASAAPGGEAQAAQGLPDPPAKLAPQGAKGPRGEEAENGSPPREGSSAAPAVRIKEEPVDEGEAPKETSSPGAAPGPEPEPDASSQGSSPHSLHSVKVKSEIASPTPGSSPVPSEPGSGPSGGTLFLPQYVFGHEATVVPQASEILAKMSELGATCFECEITFNNINNYYVHKRLYCSSRRAAEESPPGPRKLKAALSAAPKAPPAPGVLLSPQPPGEGPAAQEGEPGRDALPPVPEIKQEIKVEEGGAKASPSPEAEGAGRTSEDSQSPGGSSVEELDDDPSRTVCEACSIRFSRHETYMVHKRYYCASRHDPPLRRSGAAGKVPFLPQPIRTRKRRKLYEIHGTSSQLGSAPDLPRPELPAAVPALVSAVRAAPSPSSSPDAEGPIDLSKKPRLHGGEVLPASLLPLADYHECTACRISFHSLESYLAHKKYYCPATPLQPSTLEQLTKIKGAGPALLKPPGSPLPGGPEEEHEGGAVKAEKALPSLSPAAPPAAAFPGLDSHLQRYLDAKAAQLPGAKVPLAGCPYCPPNGSVKGDLLEHFRSAHGLFVAQTVAGATLIEAARTLAESSLLAPLPPASPPQPLPRLRRDSFSSKEPSVNGSPHPTVSPQPLLPVSPSTPLAASPLPEAPPGTPPRYTDKSVQTPPGKGPPAPVANGNHRYCRLCNIRFSSLSTFIAHKKYYCSSHAAEHVK